MLLKIAGGLALVGAGAFLVPSPQAQEPPAGRYKIDAVHSSLLFKVKHVDTAFFYGRFNDVSGTLYVDPEAPEESLIRLRIPVAGIDTNSANRDQHLKGPDFFNAVEHPDISFESTRVEEADPGVLEVTGDLTLHGVTREVTLRAERTGHSESAAPLGSRVGYHTEFTIDRRDFDITYSPQMLGTDVTLIASIEAVKE